MQRRDILHTLAALSLPGILAACGGGGANSPAPEPEPPPVIAGLVGDKYDYTIGDRPHITATFSGGNGRLEPGGIPVVSGTPVVLDALTGNTTIRLVVGNGKQEVSAELTLKSSYRGSFKAIAMGFARDSHVAVRTAAGSVLVIGGEGGPGALPQAVMAFDPASETFSVAGEILTGRTHHTATVLNDGSVLIVGGSRSVFPSPIAERFDPRTGKSLATAGQPSIDRFYHSATLLPDGRVFLAGGNSPLGNAASNTADIYDPATDRFTRFASTLLETRFGHTAMMVTSDILMLYAGSTTDARGARPELVDLSSQTTSPSNPPFDIEPRLFANAVKRTWSDWVVVGGETWIDSIPQSTVVTVSIGGIAIQPGGNLSVARTLCASAELPDGRVLVTGGTSNLPRHALASSELYAVGHVEAATVPGPSLGTARMLHTATALPNGKVIIIGGLGADRQPLASAEIFS